MEESYLDAYKKIMEETMKHIFGIATSYQSKPKSIISHLDIGGEILERSIQI